MKTILAAIFKETVVSFVALLVLVALIWFGGEYFGFAVEWRIGVIIAVLAVWLGLYIIQRVLAVRRSLLIEKRLRAQAEEQIAASRPTEKGQLAELEKQLREALEALKSSKLGKRALYTLPWYVVIGPPGSGKSTALEQSGLNFPFTSGGSHGVRGVGGTRNCDWWFTDQGILLDTAGRYTTQAEDRDEWLGFLDMIKKVRKQKPINGAIVAISISDLLTADDAKIEEHAKQVRERLDELCRGLEQVFPVYLLFTKCDLLHGFVDFFEDLGREQRAQVWGFTLPYAPLTTESYQEKFGREVRDLADRLCDVRIGRISSDRPDEKKVGIFEFPVQFRMAEKKLGEFVGQVFRANPYQESSILRGIYFSSGTQEGLPIDQLVTAMKGAYGIEGPTDAMAPVVEKKSYFLTHVFTKLIFPDQQLARSSTKVAKRRRLVRLASCAGALIGLIGFGSLLLASYGANGGLLDRVGEAASAVNDSARTSPNNAESRLGTLEGFRKELIELDELEREGRPLHMRWGLYQGRKIAAPAREFYFDHLTSLLIQPGVRGIEDELKALHQNPKKGEEDYERMYALHRVYSMLADLMSPVKSELETALQSRNRWFRGLGFAEGDTLPEDVRRLGYEQLGFFLSQLDRRGEWEIQTSDTLIRVTKDQLSQNHWVYRSYDEIRPANDAEGAQVGRDGILSRKGRDLVRTDYVFPAFFTQKGWDANCKPSLLEKSRLLADRYEDLGITNDRDEISEKLAACYTEDSRRYWGQFFDSIHLVAIDDIADAAKKLAVLSNPDESPLVEIFTRAWAAQDIALALPGQPVMDKKPAVPEGEAPPKTWLDEALEVLARVQGPLDGLVANTAAGKRVMPAALEDKLASLDPVREAFQTGKRDLEQILGRAKRDQRKLAKRLFMQAFDGAKQAFLRECRAEVDAWWRGNVKETVSGSLARRFPFVGAKEEAGMDAVAKVFRPKSGALWQAEEAIDRLAEYIFDQQPLIRVSDPVKAVFARAKEFRDALFLGSSSAEIDVRFKLRMIKRARVKDMRVTVGDVVFKLHDVLPGKSKSMTWGQGATGVKFEINANRGQWLEKEYTSGEWGLIRMLRDGTVRPRQGSEGRKFRLSWEFTSRDAAATKFEADLEFESALDSNIFRHDVFVGWESLPEKVGE